MDFLTDGDSGRKITRTAIIRNAFFILLGITALILKRHYSGPCMEIVNSYAGNVSVSFAIYFIVTISIFGRKYGRLAAVVIALLAVQLFEITNGFGVMSNVYDHYDLLANAVGIGFGWMIDTVASRFDARKLNRNEQSKTGMGE
jgi:hypothetical protein